MKILLGFEASPSVLVFATSGSLLYVYAYASASASAFTSYYEIRGRQFLRYIFYAFEETKRMKNGKEENASLVSKKKCVYSSPSYTIKSFLLAESEN